MAYRNNDSGCGFSFIYLVLFILVILVGGIKSCVNGNIKMPKLGSHHVSGGSGGYGSSNGYNVQYQNTTSPNLNSSMNDYGYTNSYPTEYRKGGSSSSNSSSSPNSAGSTHTTQSTSHSKTSSVSRTNETSRPTYSVSKETCSRCDGIGVARKVYRFDSFGGAISCGTCGRTDTHTHETWENCPICFGKGYIEYETCSHCKGVGHDTDGNYCFYCSGKGKTKRAGLRL